MVLDAMTQGNGTVAPMALYLWQCANFKGTHYSIKRSLSVQKGNQHFHKLVILREEFWLKIMILPLKVFNLSITEEYCRESISRKIILISHD